MCVLCGLGSDLLVLCLDGSCRLWLFVLLGDWFVFIYVWVCGHRCSGFWCLV